MYLSCSFLQTNDPPDLKCKAPQKIKCLSDFLHQHLSFTSFFFSMVKKYSNKIHYPNIKEEKMECFSHKTIKKTRESFYDERMSVASRYINTMPLDIKLLLMPIV